MEVDGGDGVLAAAHGQGGLGGPQAGGVLLLEVEAVGVEVHGEGPQARGSRGRTRAISGRPEGWGRWRSTVPAVATRAAAAWSSGEPDSSKEAWSWARAFFAWRMRPRDRLEKAKMREAESLAPWSWL